MLLGEHKQLLHAQVTVMSYVSIILSLKKKSALQGKDKDMTEELYSLLHRFMYLQSRAVSDETPVVLCCLLQSMALYGTHGKLSLV